MDSYQIVHHTLGNPIRYLYSSDPCYVVIWDKAYAVAHRWVEAGIKSEQEFQTIIDGIEPAAIENTDQASILSLSVVICTRNRTAALKRCIEQLLQSDDRDFEIIVVDNAPDTSATKEMLLAFRGVKYILETRKGLDIARNTGAVHASNAIVAYTDDDVWVHPSWVASIKQSFADTRTMAVTGLILPLSLNSPSQIFFEKYWSFNKGYQKQIFDTAYFESHNYYTPPVWDIGAGANMAFRKEAFFFNGFFDERLDVGAAGCSGDSAYWYKILANGWNCVYNPAAIVFHEHRQTTKDLKKQLYAYMRGQVASLFVQYEWFGEKGNLRRVYKALPQYYWQRMKQKIKSNGAFNNYLWDEIAGAVSGIFFYLSNRKKDRFIRSQLFNDAPSTENALVSIIITNYNYGHYIGEAINSCLAQTHAQIEIIVVDDGSTDGSMKVLSGFPMAKLVKANRVGLSAARNRGVLHASGVYVLFLDADDYLMPEAVALHLVHFNYYRKAVFSVGDHVRINEKGDVLPVRPHKPMEGNAFPDLLEGNFIAMEGAVLYRKELFDYFRFDINLHACEDYDLNLTISRFFPCVSHKHIVAVYRVHGLGMSANKMRMWEAVQAVYQKISSKIQFPEELLAVERGMNNWKRTYLNE